MDIEAHGQIGAGLLVPQHIVENEKGDLVTEADTNFGYEWTNSKMNRLKKVTNSKKRLDKTAEATKNYLITFLQYVHFSVG